MLEIVNFDKNHPGWLNNNRINEAYVNSMINYARETLFARDSMRMSELLDIFGGELYPGDSDYVVNVDRGVRYSYQLMDDDTWIKILIYY